MLYLFRNRKLRWSRRKQSWNAKELTIQLWSHTAVNREVNEIRETYIFCLELFWKCGIDCRISFWNVRISWLNIMNIIIHVYSWKILEFRKAKHSIWESGFYAPLCMIVVLSERYVNMRWNFVHIFVRWMFHSVSSVDDFQVDTL